MKALILRMNVRGGYAFSGSLWTGLRNCFENSIVQLSAEPMNILYCTGLKRIDAFAN
jgi:hypothetical protein